MIEEKATVSQRRNSFFENEFENICLKDSNGEGLNELLLDYVPFIGHFSKNTLKFEQNLKCKLVNYGNKELKLVAYRNISKRCKKYTLADISNELFGYFEFDDELNSKFKCHLSRTRSEIYEIAICNDWDYWCTFTIDKTKYDRYNLHAYYRDFRDFLYSVGRLKLGNKTAIKYLLVPEQHKDGAWHIHGLIRGLPLEYLSLARSPGGRFIERQGNKVYNWLGYQEKFGFSELEAVRSEIACSKYITKYITKDMLHNDIEIGKHLYYCSKGLNRASVIASGTLLRDMGSDFDSPYVLSRTAPYSEDYVERFSSYIELVDID